MDAKSVVFELTCGNVCERNSGSGRFSSETLPDGKKCFAPLPRTVYLVRIQKHEMNNKTSVSIDTVWVGCVH